MKGLNMEKILFIFFGILFFIAGIFLWNHGMEKCRADGHGTMFCMAAVKNGAYVFFD